MRKEENVGLEEYGVEAGIPGEIPAAESCTTDGSSEPCVGAKNLVGPEEIRDGYVIIVVVCSIKIN